MKLQQKQTSVFQEIERILEMCCIRITSFVSNISGQSVLEVARSIAEGEKNPNNLIKLVHGRIIKKHGAEKIKSSRTGFITPHYKLLLKLSLDELSLLQKQSEICVLKMEEICEKYYKRQLELLLTIPGINVLSAMMLIAETGGDMKAFESSGKFAGWTGLRPRNDESAGKYKSTAITKGNKYLRCILVQIAWGAIRMKNSYFKENLLD